VLGFGGVEVDRLLDYLYPALANEIQQPINLAFILFLGAFWVFVLV